MFNVILDGRGPEGELLNAARLASQICQEAEIRNFEDLIRTFVPAVRRPPGPDNFKDLMAEMLRSMGHDPDNPAKSWAWQENDSVAMPEWTKYPNKPLFDVAQTDPDYLRTAARAAAGDVTNPSSLRFARMATTALKAMGKPGL